jgi:hypothetical protein
MSAAPAAAVVQKTHKLFTLVLLATPRSPQHTLRTPPITPTSSSSSSPSSFPYSSSPYAHVLLGLKQRGFGTGKWNGFGGKVEKGEEIRDAAVREMKEEAGIESDTVDRWASIRCSIGLWGSRI